MLRLPLPTTGWLDKSPDGLPQVNTTAIKPYDDMSGANWKAAVQAKRQEILAERNKSLSSQPKSGTFAQDPNEYDVKVVDKSYLFKDFQAKSEEAQKMIDDVVLEFNLNQEQERAFRIVANHAVTPEAEQLKMYMGGMGGTGKSQVIKALMHFFKLRNESHRIVVLGPTGTSAALLNGSTYHSFLGISMKGEYQRNENVTVTQIQARLDGVDYIFLDEISMVACHEFYKISS